MTLGGTLGLAGIQLPLVESGIALSLLILGVLVATATRLPLAVSATLVGLFALAHGYAHGTEIPTAASGVTYALGFVLATTGLHVIGIGVGLLTERLHAPQLQRIAGFSIAACGLYLIIG
jgi:urease accessory protein